MRIPINYKSHPPLVWGVEGACGLALERNPQIATFLPALMGR